VCVCLYVFFLNFILHNTEGVPVNLNSNSYWFYIHKLEKKVNINYYTRRRVERMRGAVFDQNTFLLVISVIKIGSFLSLLII